MSALQTSGVVLPRSVATVVTGKAKDTSTIASLSPSKPELFNDETYLVFTGASEAEVVAEGAAKDYYEQTLSPVVAKRVTVQTTTRISKQLKWADEDDQLKIVDSIQEDQALAIGRALDYIVYHAINPKSGQALQGFTPLTAMSGVNDVYLGTTAKAATKAQLLESFDKMAEEINETYDINGLAMAKAYANAMRKIRVHGSDLRLYPNIPLNLKVGEFEGVNAVCSSTVNGGLAQTPTNVLAIMGDFSLIKWGMVRDMRAEVIEFGDPDGQGDLKRYNQIAYRTEAVLGYAVVNPAAFSILYSGDEPEYS
jgi:HK97 family phage major capsid protein